jgi:hypothetical protein
VLCECLYIGSHDHIKKILSLPPIDLAPPGLKKVKGPESEHAVGPGSYAKLGTKNLSLSLKYISSLSSLFLFSLSHTHILYTHTHTHTHSLSLSGLSDPMPIFILLASLVREELVDYVRLRDQHINRTPAEIEALVMKDRAHLLGVRENTKYKRGKEKTKKVNVNKRSRYEKLTEAQLRQILEGQSKDTKGKKDELIARLTNEDDVKGGSEVDDGLDGLFNEDLESMLRARDLPISGCKATKIERL